MAKVYRTLLARLASGHLCPGDLLPKERDLAEELATNRMNVNRAVKVLEKHKLVECKRHVGTRVASGIDYDKVEALLKAANRKIFVLYSTTPHGIHWNQTSFEELENVVEPEGFTVTYRTIPVSGGRPEYQQLLTEISDAGASALVIFPDFSADNMNDSKLLEENADLLLNLQMPIFMLNRSGKHIPLNMVSFVSMDPFGDGALIGSLLCKEQPQQVILLNEPSGSSFWGIKRLEGLKMGLSGRVASGDVRLENIAGNRDGLMSIVGKIAQADGAVTVVAINNEFAARLIDLCSTDDLTIPEHYQLIAFDDNPLFHSYRLSSLAVPMQEIGFLFGKLICDTSWLGNYRGKVSIKVNSTLIVRDTFMPEKKHK